MKRGDVAEIAKSLFGFERASVAVLKASERTRGAARLAVATPVHDIGTRREPPDPTDAAQPASEPLIVPSTAGMTTRTLANGLRVVLLPITSVPTVDIRMVFRAGTGDEPATKRGAALIAGEALSWDRRHLGDALTLSAAGGTTSVHVTEDHVVFLVRGLDMHIDYLLSALGRIVRDGRYGIGASAFVRAMRHARQIDDHAVNEAFRTAQYGEGHPYVGAGRDTSQELALADVESFRAARFTPDNAMLVISGRFDAALAERWIDHLFATWQGVAAPRTDRQASVQPASIAKDEDLAMVDLRIALPVAGGARAERLVVAAMLLDVVRDVRHQLGAAYALDASLDELRLSSIYSIAGSVDAGRTHEAITLIRDRLAQLRADPDAAARGFVLARRRVLVALSSTTGSATSLGERVTTDVSLDRAPLSDVELATRVHRLTIDRMTTALGDLELARAAILMRGPTADVDRAFAVLGRTPARLPAPQVVVNEIDHPGDPSADPFEDDTTETTTTDTRVSLSVLPGFTWGTTQDREVDGSMISAHIGVRIDRFKAAGVLLSMGDLSGSYRGPFHDPRMRPIEIVPVSASVFLQGILRDRLWGSMLAGFHFDRIVDDAGALPLWRTGLAIGLEGGVDVVRFRGVGLTIFGRAETELGSQAAFTGLSLGIGLRR